MSKGKKNVFRFPHCVSLPKNAKLGHLKYKEEQTIVCAEKHWFLLAPAIHSIQRLPGGHFLRVCLDAPYDAGLQAYNCKYNITD